MGRLSTLSRSIAGKVAIITGAGSGMGRATAHLFADEGAKVAVVDVNREGVDRVASEITDAGGTAAAWAIDVTNARAIVTLVSEVVARFGGVDILVNNAGVSLPAPIDSDDFDQAWARTLAVNLTAHVQLIRACLPHLKAQRSGRIVNIASTEGLGATAFISPYTSSKHGVIGLPLARRRAGLSRGYGQLHLPGSDQHRDDSGHPRRGEAEVRPPPRAAAALR